MTIKVNNTAALMLSAFEAARGSDWTFFVVNNTDEAAAAFKKWRLRPGDQIAVICPKAADVDRQTIFYDYTPKGSATRLIRRTGAKWAIVPAFESVKATADDCGRAALEAIYEERVEQWRYYDHLYPSTQKLIRAEATDLHRRMIAIDSGGSDFTLMLWEWVMTFFGEPGAGYADVWQYTDNDLMSKRLPWGWRNADY